MLLVRLSPKPREVGTGNISPSFTKWSYCDRGSVQTGLTLKRRCAWFRWISAEHRRRDHVPTDGKYVPNTNKQLND
jgi:hypothetical protein